MRRAAPPSSRRENAACDRAPPPRCWPRRRRPEVKSLAELGPHHAFEREHEPLQLAVEPLVGQALLHERTRPPHRSQGRSPTTRLYQAVRRASDRPCHRRSVAACSSVSQHVAFTARVTISDGGPVRRSYVARRWMQTSMTFDIASKGASQTCSAISARPTTALACSTRCSSSAYSRAGQDERLAAAHDAARARVQFEGDRRAGWRASSGRRPRRMMARRRASSSPKSNGLVR